MYKWSNSFGRHRQREIFLSSEDKILAGVCGGLGRHFDISSKLVRLGFLIGTLFQPVIVPILYAAAAYLMPKRAPTEEGETSRFSSNRTRQKTNSDLNNMANQLNQQFDLMEKKIQKMEDHVTSREYILRRELDSL